MRSRSLYTTWPIYNTGIHHPTPDSLCRFAFQNVPFPPPNHSMFPSDHAPCRYPFCLHMLELLQSPNFRREVARDTVTRFIDDQMLLHWQNYIRKRAELIAKHVQVLEAGVPGQSLPSGLGPPPPLGSSSTSGGTGATGGPPFL